MVSATVTAATTDLRKAVAKGADAFEAWLKAVTFPADRAHQLVTLSRAELRELGGCIDNDRAVQLSESVHDELSAHALAAMEAEDAARISEALDTDHAVDVLREMKGPVREGVLAAMSPAKATLYHDQLSWPESSVAAHMVADA